MATGGDSARPVEDDACVGGKMPVLCDLCRQRKKTFPAVAVCSTCDVNLCNECCQGHRMFTHEHVIVPLDNEVIDAVLTDMKGLDRCSAHDRAVRFICKDHKSLCCDDCQFDFHRACKDIYKLQEVSTDANRFLIKSVEDVHRAISTARDVVANCDMKIEVNEERRNKIMSEIERKKEVVMKCFDDAKKRIGENLDQHITSDKTRLDDVKIEAESVQINLQDLMSLNDIVRKDGTNVEKFILDFTCDQKAALATAKLTDMEKNNNTVQHTLEWNDHLLELMNEQLVSLRSTESISTMETTVETDHSVGKV